MEVSFSNFFFFLALTFAVMPGDVLDSRFYIMIYIILLVVLLV